MVTACFFRSILLYLGYEFLSAITDHMGLEHRHSAEPNPEEIQKATEIMSEDELQASAEREERLREVRPELRVKEELDRLHLRPQELVLINRKPTAGLVGDQWTERAAIYLGHDDAYLHVEYPNTHEIELIAKTKLLDHLPLWLITSVERA